ncbi:uncharacterized protein LOC119873352 isoform X1 [Canis lupus familiaris]|uniref:uncharacterized protein LOC119873352 isoform X1 n=1 Tax=Canis lupus familiaris TaxID=9615 RepID=UPI0018F3DB03|nr:uncharacterized protein LOC119873352 isoform X1 [Canis lupus familiaris]XP_038471766.1 uncharacterized protein LOC119873352 isoform X1 [Canis lupus familiaris]XP_038534068.1 uncharacterized protein LOC119873352 isoform X1 [Canis lupus familiaris]
MLVGGVKGGSDCTAIGSTQGPLESPSPKPSCRDVSPPALPPPSWGVHSPFRASVSPSVYEDGRGAYCPWGTQDLFLSPSGRSEDSAEPHQLAAVSSQLEAFLQMSSG